MSMIRTLLALCCALVLSGCAAANTTTATNSVGADSEIDAHEHEDTSAELSPVDLAEGERLQVVATTNIVADVVAHVGGDAIDLVSLMPVGADPHAFEPAPGDIVALNEAHVIFINGLHLEESLDSIFDSLDGNAALVSVNAGVETHDFAEESHADEDEHVDEEEHGDEDEHEGEHAHEGANPHTWFSIAAVEQWVENIEHTLSELDPAGADDYAANAEAYLVELTALHTELNELVEQIPTKQRKLVTDHDSLGYFADAYGFTVVGTVLPSLSTLASPSAGQLAKLQEQIEAEEVRAIFVGTTVNPDLAEQIAADTGAQVVPIYTGSLSDEDGPASSYIDFMRYNATAIVKALQE